MQILLTGGSGFIGRNIIKYLGDKYRILAPGHEQLDLLDEQALYRFFKDHEIEVLIHSAVKPGHRNAKDLNAIFFSNMRMFYNILQCQRYFGKLIYLSSGAVYDQRNDLHRVREDDYLKQVPADELGLYKWVSAREIAARNNMIELRLFGVFGPYEDYAIRFISNAIGKALFDLPLSLRQNRVFDYLYIEDLMPVLEYFINCSEREHRAYNVTPDQSCELYELARMVRATAGKDLPIIVAREGLGLEYSGDNSRLRSAMPALRFTAIEDAIARLYDWYEKNLNTIDRSVLLWDK